MVKVWTTKEVQLLHKLHTQGIPRQTIADILERSLTSVNGKLDKEKHTSSKYLRWSTADRNRLTQLYLDGYTYKELAVIFNRSADTIRNRLTQWDVTRDVDNRVEHMVAREYRKANSEAMK